MVTLSLDTWVSLVVLVTALSGFYVALRRELRSELSSEIGSVRTEIGSVRADVGSLRTELQSTRSELQAEVGSLRTELQSTRSELRAEIREEGARLESLILRLDDRVYALAAGLHPTPDDQPIPPRRAAQQ